jgi:hypothetical protein
MTGNDVMQEALFLVQRIRNFNQIASADDIATCQLALNNLLDEWNGLGITAYSATPITGPLTSGVSTYSLGPGGTFSATRPVAVEAWNVRTTSGQANGGKPVDAVEFATLAADRSAQGARVKALNYDAAFPLGFVHLYPTPSGGSLELWTWSALASISDFTLTLVYPPGYLKAIIYALAMDIGSKFERPIDPGIKLVAGQALAGLLATNARQRHMPTPVPAE